MLLIESLITPVSGIMASRHLVLIMCLMIGRTSGQDETCAASIPGVSAKPGFCPSTWIQWEGNCYKATGQALTYTQAREECVQMGGMMVVPQSDSETQFLIPFIPYENTTYEFVEVHYACCFKC